MKAATKKARKGAAKAFVEAHGEAEAPDFFSISDLSEEFGVTHRAIRFYETKGLLSPKRLNGARIYSRRDRARLRIIVRAKSLGYTLEDTKDYLDLYGQQGEGRIKQLEITAARSAEMIAELQAKKQQIDEQIEELRLINEVCRRKITKKKAR
ncbi:MAG: MerR family DNA-binding transcriptional regulator [Myxococcales bacterium]|nr:MerR family DNA-binding transcriptional regulator [Myxococcales bacterium]